MAEPAGNAARSVACRLPLDHLLFLTNVPAGLDWSVVGHWTMVFRKTAQPCEPPIRVTPIGDTGMYRVIDGRHRTVAAYVAGRVDIDAIVDPQ